MNGTRVNVETVRGWSNLALELNALNHCLPRETPFAAPGPCASAYALGLLHAILADACAVTLSAGYNPEFMSASSGNNVSDVDMFMGGACYGLLKHIYSDPDYDNLYKDSLQNLPNGSSGGNNDWDRGVQAAAVFKDLWTAARAKDRLDPMSRFYTPAADKHQEDPRERGQNGQGFYGQAWAGKTRYVSGLPNGLDTPVAPLGLQQTDIDAAYAPLANPPGERTPRFLESGRQVKTVGAVADAFNNGPGGVQLTVGTFWAYDGAANIGTPPRLYNQILYQVLEANKMDSDAAELARSLALYNLALANASIVAWRGKYEHAIARPIVWIQEIDTVIQDNDWLPLGSPRSTRQSSYCKPKAQLQSLTTQSLVLGPAKLPSSTPNFPAYPSGHATFGGACFTVMAELLGGKNLSGDVGVRLKSNELDRNTTDPFTEKERPTKDILFKTTEDLIDANAYSRILLGVHWDFDGIDGVAAGRIIGQRTVDKLYQLAGKGGA